MELTNEQLDRIDKGEISEAILTDGSKVRVFIATSGFLCRFKKGSKRRGYTLHQSNIQILVEPKTEQEKQKTIEEINYKMVAKFRKQAAKATFTNDFIRDCLALPDTFEKWVEEGKKSPYDYSVTTGCKITGDLVSVKSIGKKLGRGNSLEEAIKNKREFSSGHFEFNGYDGSLHLKKEENGDFKGYLNKEYRNCGNGYYYLLINDEYFIGYDVD